MISEKDWSETYESGYTAAISDALRIYREDPSSYEDNLKYLLIVIPEILRERLDKKTQD